MKFRIPEELSNQLRNVDETLSQMLLRLMRERNLNAAECCKIADIDRRHFSKIRHNTNYRPRKRTAILFAFALELDLGTTQKFLETAGFTLSHSDRADIVVSYCIQHGIYNLFYVNELLIYCGLEPFEDGRQ